MVIINASSFSLYEQYFWQNVVATEHILPNLTFDPYESIIINSDLLTKFGSNGA